MSRSLMKNEDFWTWVAIVLLIICLFVVAQVVPKHPLEKPRPATPPESFHK